MTKKKELSGTVWVSRFPNSSSIDDLSLTFKPKVQNFIAALQTANATVTINSTLRPPERAYLMHYSYEIANGLDPAKVPAKNGVDIDWVHPTLKQSIDAASQMVSGYGIVFEPALASRHTEGNAIDMDISWQNDLTIIDANKKSTTIKGVPRTGMHHQLWSVGQSYGVVKLATDQPHWSSDGH